MISRSMGVRSSLLSACIALSACGGSDPDSGLACAPASDPDGHEPPCNPHIAASTYPTAHLNNYAQDSTPLRGPEPGDTVSAHNHALPSGVPIGAIFTPPYPDGRVAVWLSTITALETGELFKVDASDGSIIARYDNLSGAAESPNNDAPAISRIYGFLDRRNRLYRASGPQIEVMGDVDPLDSRSPITRLARYELPASARCRADDYVIGVWPMWNGQVGFSTYRGVIGVFTPDRPEGMEADLAVYSINGERCDDARVSDAELETTSNNPASDELHAIYPITDAALYRFDLAGGRLQLTWRAEYRTGTAGGGGVRLDSGSGSSPTLMGLSSDRDRFVVFTDGADVMNLVLMWRDEIPADWQPIAPGKDRRIACELPLTFGDDATTASQSEQSVVVRGYAAFVPNNQLRNTVVTDTVLQALALLPGASASVQVVNMTLAGLLGGVPINAPFGFERIDWDPTARHCAIKWINRNVSIPNGVPFLSVGSRIVYGIGQRNGVFGLEGMDMDTGESVLWVPGGVAPTYNSFYTALNIAPDGSMWTGGFLGYTRYSLERRP